MSQKGNETFTWEYLSQKESVTPKITRDQFGLNDNGDTTTMLPHQFTTLRTSDSLKANRSFYLPIVCTGRRPQ